MRRLIRAVVAALILAGLLAGIPLVVAHAVPDPAAGWSDLQAGDLSDRAVIEVLAAVALLAWLQFAVAALVEIVAAVARVRVPRRLPGVFGGQQRLAHALVVAIVVLAAPLTGRATSGPAGTPTGPSAPPAHTGVGVVAAASVLPGPVAATAPAASAAAVSTYVIESDGPGTYWDLAERFLGGGRHWQAIWQLNAGRTQPDGTRMDSPGLLRPGWTVQIPSHPGTGITPVTVHSGDTLSGIAAAHDVTDWHRLWDANAGRHQPGGRRFTNPDHIEPGWTINVPPHDRPATRAAPTTPPTARPTQQTQSVPATASPSPTSAGGGASPTASDAAPPVPSSVTVQRESPTSQPVPTNQPAEPDGVGAAALAAFGTGAGLLAGVSAVALVRYRRRQFRHRRPGRAIPAPRPDLAPMERALRTAPTAEASWFDEALRGLTHLLAADPNGRLPDVLAACLSGPGLQLVLAAPHHDPPGAWATDAAGTRWRLLRGDPTGYDPDRRAYQVAPYPGLASIGHTPETPHATDEAGQDVEQGQYWMVDLERAGVVAITGDRERCLDLARSLAAELAHNTWSEQLSITLAGFGAELAPINPERLDVTTDTVAALAAATARLDATTGIIDRAGVDVLHGRLRDVAGDAWFPHILFLAPRSTDAVDQTSGIGLSAFAERIDAVDARAAVAVVTAGGVPAGLHLHVDTFGTLHVPALGLTLVADRLPAVDAAQLADLLAAAAHPGDAPVPPARGDAPWDALTDAAGALRVDPTDSVDDRGPIPAGPRQVSDGTAIGPPAESILPLPDRIYLDASATTTSDLAALAPAVSDPIRRRAADADPTLAEDLSAWHDPASPRPRVALLGPVTVHASGTLPEASPRRAWNTEVVAYLATHPRGVTAEQLATALWPDDPDAASKSKLRQAVSIARRWLGTDPITGADHVPSAVNPVGGPGLYRVDGVLVDADLFRRLRLRAVAHGADGIPDLDTALALVRGPAFDQRRPGGYGWLADTPLDHEFTGMIVDVAHTVATAHLAGGRPDAAATAARTALLAGSSDDIALLDLVAACDAQGHRAEADRLVRRILANHDADVEEDLPPRTADILHRRRWLDQAG